VDFAFLPISGQNNNMNARDAADFAYEIGAKCAIPIHYGLVDDRTPDEFDFDDRIILEPYKETTL
jgi:L-ascorbate metabolism protein UlaG (beta-lactamase superfamily)